MSDPGENPDGNGLLVIGYGNELRCDDGVGPRVAGAVEQLKLPGVRSIACHQLTPELADPISRSTRVVFVDATVEVVTGVQLRELEPSKTGEILAHAADPRALLALARDVFGHFPPAWWLTIPIENLEVGEELSPLAKQGLQIAIARIQELAAGPGNTGI